MKQQLEANGSLLIRNNEWEDGDIVEMSIKSDHNIEVALLDDAQANGLNAESAQPIDNSFFLEKDTPTSLETTIVPRDKRRHILIVNKSNQKSAVNIGLIRAKKLPKYFGGSRRYFEGYTGTTGTSGLSGI